jgi:mRNA interferase RelE/StbE
LPYAIRYAPAARRQLRKLDQADQRRLVTRIDHLADDPRPDGCRKLAGHQSLYRIRVGDFRIVYEVKNQELIVLIAMVSHRRDVYEEIKRRR